jgi:hypothetical protein
MKSTTALIASVLLAVTVEAQTQKAGDGALPAGYWPPSKSRPILDKTAETVLAPDLSRLSPEERAAVRELLAAGEVMQRLYEESRHRQARESLAALQTLHRTSGSSKATENLLDLYYLSQGPIAATLDNKREPFLPVEPQQPGKNVYPWGITKEEIETYLAANPELRPEILGERTVVRRASKENLSGDLSILERNPALSLLHPQLRPQLLRLSEQPEARTLYAVPYAVAYADEMLRAYRHLNTAADLLAASDAEFARYLRNRGRDLLTNDYESGDAAWVTGRFGNLNAQIGAYETYDDALYGVKAFHSFSLLVRDTKATEELRGAIKGLQEIENSLPYDRHRTVREDIPVGIYEVIADFGQARGGNTATILPNDPLFARRYGRTILLRGNIMKNPDIHANKSRAWTAAVAPAHRDDLRPDGDFYRTLWHEIGHYLGPDMTADGRDLGIALEEHSDALEEMKSDLVSLYSVPALRQKEYYDDARVKAIYSAGILRTLQNTKPRSDQPYQTMQLAQFNYYLEKGLLKFDPKQKNLTVDYSRYHEVVAELLREVMSVQSSGNKEKAAAFFRKYGNWTPELHQALAEKIAAAQGARWRIMRYAALEE